MTVPQISISVPGNLIPANLIFVPILEERLGWMKGGWQKRPLLPPLGKAACRPFPTCCCSNFWDSGQFLSIQTPPQPPSTARHLAQPGR